MAHPTSIPHLCGSIASKPSDLGVRMHNAAYADLGIPYTYIAFGLETPEAAIAAMRTLGMHGLSVGVPHKVEVMRFLDEIDPVAQKIGAVNAIVNREGRLVGYNVDWIGAESALKEAIDIKDKTFLVIGAGGAARSICYAIQKNGGKIVLLNRDVKRAERLAQEFGIGLFDSLEHIYKYSNYDVLVNSTSVGFFDSDSCPIEEIHIPEGRMLFEAVFYPVETKLVRIAKVRGNKIIPGIRMLVYLAAQQFELYTGRKPKFEVMEKALRTGLELKSVAR